MYDHNQEAERAAPEYARVREEFELATKLGARFDIDSAMLNVDALLNACRAPAVGEDGLPPLPDQIDELHAYWICDDCDGRGHDGEAHWQGHFQPPEPFRCGTCDGTGRIKVKAYTAEQYRQGQREAFEAGRRNGWFDGAGDVAKLTAPSEQPDGLPPLPDPDGSASVPVDEEKFTFTEVDAWSKSLVIQFARDAAAADRQARVQNTSKNVHNDAIQSVIACAQRVHAKFGADSDWSEWRDLGDALKELGAQQPASAAQGVKTWQERMPEHVKFIGSASSELPYMKAEIDDLRNFTASLQASFDAAVSLARETIDARNAEINDLRAQLARKSQEYVDSEVGTPD